jgi:hypothetical protein
LGVGARRQAEDVGERSEQDCGDADEVDGCGEVAEVVSAFWVYL